MGRFKVICENFGDSKVTQDNILIRQMQLEDIVDVYAIETATQPVPWSEGIFRDCLAAGYHAWVLLREEIMLGYILAYIRSGECHILNVCVRADVQGSGYGRKLMENALNMAKQEDADLAILEVRPSNERAINLYRSLGFNEIGVRKDYYAMPDGVSREDALVLALQMG